MTKRQIIRTPKELNKYEKMLSCIVSGINRYYNKKNGNYKELYYHNDCFVLRYKNSIEWKGMYIITFKEAIKQYNKIKL